MTEGVHTMLRWELQLFSQTSILRIFELHGFGPLTRALEGLGCKRASLDLGKLVQRDHRQAALSDSLSCS